MKRFSAYKKITFYFLLISLYSCSSANFQEKKQEIEITNKNVNPMPKRIGGFVRPDLKQSHNIYQIDSPIQPEEIPTDENEFKKIGLEKMVLYIKVRDEIMANETPVYKIYSNKCIITTTSFGPNESKIKLKNPDKNMSWETHSVYHITIATGDIDESHEECENIKKEDKPIYTFSAPKSKQISYVEFFITPDMEVRKN